ncbi:hypothetical protein D9M71_809790 [compost metagenome]
MGKGRECFDPVQIIFVFGDAVAVLLEQFDVQLLFFDWGHAEPGRQGLLLVNCVGDPRCSAQIGIESGPCHIFQRFRLFSVCEPE